MKNVIQIVSKGVIGRYFTKDVTGVTYVAGKEEDTVNISTRCGVDAFFGIEDGFFATIPAEELVKNIFDFCYAENEDEMPDVSFGSIERIGGASENFIYTIDVTAPTGEE